MGILLALIVLPTLLPPAPAETGQSAISFIVCAQSDTWTRPTAAEQAARIWNDPRYADIGPTAFEWTHDFIWNPAQSASISYHNRNLSGLWTADMNTPGCPRHDGEWDQWIEIWSLEHRVLSVHSEGGVYTITVEPLGRGFQIVQFRRSPATLAAPVTLGFVETDGGVLQVITSGDRARH